MGIGGLVRKAVPQAMLDPEPIFEHEKFKYGGWTGVGGSSQEWGVFAELFTSVGSTKQVNTPPRSTHQRFDTTTTINTVAGLKTNNYCERDQNPWIRFFFELEQIDDCRAFIGWSNGDGAIGPAGADPLANEDGIMLKLDSGDTNFEIYHNSGDATSATGGAIKAADSNRHLFELRAINSVPMFQWKIDRGAWNDITTDIPSASTDLGVQCYIENTIGANKFMRVLWITTRLDSGTI